MTGILVFSRPWQQILHPLHGKEDLQLLSYVNFFGFGETISNVFSSIHDEVRVIFTQGY
jgi:hypothetical protein